MKKQSFVILKKDRLVADTICRALEDAGYESFGCFTQTNEAIETATARNPDYFLTETDLPDNNGYSVIRQVKQRVKVDCIIRTTGRKKNMQDALQTNVSGYLHAVNSGIDELLICLKTIQQGKRYISSDIELPLNSGAIQEIENLNNLSERERTVLKLMLQGTENEQIASVLNMSVHTLNSHLTHMKAKLGVNTTRQLVVRGVHLKHLLSEG